MLRLIYCLRRRSDLSPEVFRRYWLEEHGPRVRQRMGALGIRRYVQLHALTSSSTRSPAALPIPSPAAAAAPSLSTAWPGSRSTIPTP